MLPRFGTRLPTALGRAGRIPGGWYQLAAPRLQGGSGAGPTPLPPATPVTNTRSQAAAAAAPPPSPPSPDSCAPAGPSQAGRKPRLTQNGSKMTQNSTPQRPAGGQSPGVGAKRVGTSVWEGSASPPGGLSQSSVSQHPRSRSPRCAHTSAEQHLLGQWEALRVQGERQGGAGESSSSAHGWDSDPECPHLAGQ